jgi:phage/plasmid-like protein (TIGR03299 family)
MVSARITPWHELGVVVEKNMRAREALVLASLDWTVEKWPLYAESHDIMAVGVDTHMATVRSTDARVLGVVGKDYEPIQNERMLTWAELVVDTGEAQFTTAGSLRNGQIVFACLEVDTTVKLPGGDQILPYFVVATSHDGSHALKAFTSPIRVVCKNTLDMALGKAGASFSIRHTLNSDWRLESARRMLGMVVGYYDSLGIEAGRLVSQTIIDAEFNRMVADIFPVPEDPTPRQRDVTHLRRAQVKTLYHGETIGQFRGTAWGAFNAVNEYELWERRVKGSRAERHALRALNRDFPLTHKAHLWLTNA